MSASAHLRCRLAGFCLVAPDADALAGFYELAFGARREASGQLDARRSAALFGVPGTTRDSTIRLGTERIDIVAFEQAGGPYPAACSASDPLFQHFAIVVSEIGAAMAHLRAVPGWTAITRGGPQCLPPSSGGATAFKFRDPAGHPLELLEFPPGSIPQKWQDRRGAIFLGIDHSAITVRDAASSEAFYRRLGFSPSARTLNRGPEQERLDGLPGATVEVTALSSGDNGPHIELLCYRGVSHDAPAACDNNDVAATRMALFDATLEQPTERLQDPDGHRLIVFNHPCGRSFP
jgi:catechol 2,3-dioxygenase-like lactoylglutathione lyase family enzyme